MRVFTLYTLNVFALELRLHFGYDLADGLFINETDYERLSEHSPKDPKEIIFDNGGEFVVITHGS